MELKMHRPAFVESETPVPTYQFNTLEELVAIPELKELSDTPTFKRWSISISNPEIRSMCQHLLMAEFKNGKWFVIGYLPSEADSIGLPEWMATEQEEE